MEEWGLDDFENSTAPLNVVAEYSGDVFEANILTVVPDDEDSCQDLLRKLQRNIDIHNFGLSKLTKFCGKRVKEGRTRVKPIAFFSGESSSEGGSTVNPVSIC